VSTPRRSGPDLLPDLSDVSPDSPLVVAASACLMGQPVGYDGSAFPSDPVLALADLPTVTLVPFCPEASQLPTPRRWMTIHGGDGFDVLDGNARVIDVDGVDLTAAFLRGAEALLSIVQRHGARLAILTDVSPSCGSTVIYDGAGDAPVHQPSSGVTTALLRRHGIPVISQRDHATLGRLRSALDPSYSPDPDAVDHIDGPWYQQTFVDPPVPSPEPELIDLGSP